MTENTEVRDAGVNCTSTSAETLNKIAGESAVIPEYGVRTVTGPVEKLEFQPTTDGSNRVRMHAIINGKHINLYVSQMNVVGKWSKGVNDKGKHFPEFQKTSQIKCIKSIKGIECNVPKEGVKDILNGCMPGDKISVEMDSGFVIDGVVFDRNEMSRKQFFHLMQAIGDKMGVTVGNVKVAGGVTRAVIRQGKPMTYAEIEKLFEERGKDVTIQCDLIRDNLSGNYSINNILIPEFRKS